MTGDGFLKGCSTVYQITAAQIDGNYRLNVDGLLTFHENTVARYFTAMKVAAFDMQKHDRTWVISEIDLDLPEPPVMWSEDVDFRLWISEMSPLRVWIDFTAQEVHSGKIAARGNSCWSLISMSERKLVPCDGFIPAGELVPELAAGPHKKRTALKIVEEPAEIMKHTVNAIDLDFNGHTNNRRYVQMALACFGQEFLAENRPDSLNIRFIHESRIGEDLVCETHRTDDPKSYIGRIVNGSGQEICRVTSRWKDKEALPDIAEVNLIRAAGGKPAGH